MPELYPGELDAIADDIQIVELARYTDVALLPEMNVKTAMKLFDDAEAEVLAVLEFGRQSQGDRLPQRILCAPPLCRRDRPGHPRRAWRVVVNRPAGSRPANHKLIQFREHLISAVIMIERARRSDRREEWKDARAFVTGDCFNPSVPGRFERRGGRSVGHARRQGRLRKLADRQARYGPPDQAAGLAAARRDRRGGKFLACRGEAGRRCAAGPAGLQDRIVRRRSERSAHHPRRAERRYLRRRNARRPHPRSPCRRRCGKARHQRNLRQRPSRPVRDRVLSGRQQPAMGLCRQHRQRRALSLSLRRSEGLRSGRRTSLRSCRPATDIRPATSRSRPTTSGCWCRSAPPAMRGRDGHSARRAEGVAHATAARRGLGHRDRPRRGAGVRSRRQEPEAVRHRHPQLRRPCDAAERHGLVLDQRARRSRRRPRARLCHARPGERLLWLAVVLYRRPSGPAPCRCAS